MNHKRLKNVQTSEEPMTRDEQVQLIITKYDLLYESRISKMEARFDMLEHNLDNTFKSIQETFREIKTDIRWMFGIMIGFYAIILSLMAKGFHWY